MRRSDLSPDRQACLVPTPEYPNVKAFLPPATPRLIRVQGPATRALTQAHEALGALRQASVRLPNPDMITRTLARREAVNSSQIEGTRAGLDDLYAYECTGAGEPTHADARITHNYVTALDIGLTAVRGPAGRQALTVALLQEMHRALMTGTDYADTPGSLRRQQNWIGAGARIEDATFVPPPPAAVAQCLAELADSMLRYEPRDEEAQQLSLVMQLAIAHAQFETIHPFRDGNGRIGRLLLPLILAAEGYPPLYLSGYLHRHRRQYYDALAGVQLRGEWSEWLAFLAAAVIASCQEATALTEDLLALQAQWETQLGDLRADAAARKLPALLLGHPVTSAREVSILLGISFPAANKALGILVERGLLEAPEGRRNRLFVARAIVERLERR